MEHYNKMIVKHTVKRGGVEVIYNSENYEDRIWLSFGGQFGWFDKKDAMRLVRGILKMRSDLKKIGVKL